MTSVLIVILFVVAVFAAYILGQRGRCFDYECNAQVVTIKRHYDRLQRINHRYQLAQNEIVKLRKELSEAKAGK